MRQVYDNYYKIFSCHKTARKCPDPCDITPDDFCYVAADCNDCVIEHSGLAEAYVPYQTDFDIMSAEESLIAGTTFKSLNMPYENRCCKMRRCD